MVTKSRQGQVRFGVPQEEDCRGSTPEEAFLAWAEERGLAEHPRSTERVNADYALVRISTPETEILVEIERQSAVWFVSQVTE